MGRKMYLFYLGRHFLSKYLESDKEISNCAELEKLINTIGFYLSDSNEDYSSLKNHINDLIEKLFKLSIEQNYYWQFCSYKTWQKTINIRSHEFEKENREHGANLYYLEYYELNRLLNIFDNDKKELVYICHKNGVTKPLYFKTEKIDIYNKILMSYKSIKRDVEQRINLLNNPKLFNPPATEKIKEPETKEILKTDLSTSIINGLNKYNFSEYLKETEYCIIKIKNLIKANKSSVPFIIALLSKLGFISYLLDNHFKTKELLFKNLSGTLNCNPRRIKGNVNILNKTSKENREVYTSWQHTENIDLQSLGL